MNPICLVGLFILGGLFGGFVMWLKTRNQNVLRGIHEQQISGRDKNNVAQIGFAVIGTAITWKLVRAGKIVEAESELPKQLVTMYKYAALMKEEYPSFINLESLINSLCEESNALKTAVTTVMSNGCGTTP